MGCSVLRGGRRACGGSGAQKQRAGAQASRPPALPPSRPPRCRRGSLARARDRSGAVAVRANRRRGRNRAPAPAPAPALSAGAPASCPDLRSVCAVPACTRADACACLPRLLAARAHTRTHTHATRTPHARHTVAVVVVVVVAVLAGLTFSIGVASAAAVLDYSLDGNADHLEVDLGIDACVDVPFLGTWPTCTAYGCTCTLQQHPLWGTPTRRWPAD